MKPITKHISLTVLTCGVLCAARFSESRAQTAAAATNAAAPDAPGGGRGRGGLGRGQFIPPGPPAPVPPEVTMARPRQAEVDKINAALKRFIETSPDKELLKKYESLPFKFRATIPASGPPTAVG